MANDSIKGLCNETLRKSLETEAQLSFPGWQFPLRIVTLQYQEVSLRVTEASHLQPFQKTYPYAALPLADSNFYPFALIKQ